MRHTPSAGSDQALQAILDPRRLLRWIYIGRMSIASAIFVAAVFTWNRISGEAPISTLLASLVFAVTAVVTVVSAGYSATSRRPLGTTFLYLQSIFDLLLVTVVVHITSIWQLIALGMYPLRPDAGLQDTTQFPAPTQFPALYILVIASASLMLPTRQAGLLIAFFGDVLYLADVTFLQGNPTISVWLWAQLILFATVAMGSAYLTDQLRRGGEGTALLAARLEQVRLRAEDILQNIYSGIITIDPQGRLIYANTTAERMLDLSLASQANLPVLDQLRKKAPALAAALERSTRDRVRTTRAEAMVVAGGREYPIGVTTTFLEDDAGHVAATAIFQDISDTKRMEALRVRAERLEGVAELSASLAHEIKNPLASIRSSVEQISKMPSHDKDQRALSELVMRESDRLSRLLTEFLDFARVRVARSDAIDVGSVVRGAARLVMAHPDCCDGVRIDSVVPAGAPVVVIGDEDMLHRAFFNLLLNAVQAAPPASAVTIEVLTDFAESPSPEGVFEQGSIGVRVSDHGAGIPEEIRARLFDPFTTTKPQGNGLGLAVVHRAIVAHKGLVLVDSGPQGTRVTVVLPSHSPAPAFA